MARQTVVSVGGGVSNPSAVIDDISRERGKEKFQSSISAILWNQNPLFPPPDRPIPRRYREGIPGGDSKMCVSVLEKNNSRNL